MGDYELMCEATVNGEIFWVRLMVAREVYDDPFTRRHAEDNLRMRLMAKIVERFPPEISAREVLPPSPWAHFRV